MLKVSHSNAVTFNSDRLGETTREQDLEYVEGDVVFLMTFPSVVTLMTDEQDRLNLKLEKEY